MWAVCALLQLKRHNFPTEEVLVTGSVFCYHSLLKGMVKYNESKYK